MSVNWPGFVEIVKADQNQKFLLTSHIRPDCDALGSELGMAGILELLGKDVVIVNGQATPPNLAFIDPENRIKVIGEDVGQADELPDNPLAGLEGYVEDRKCVADKEEGQAEHLLAR